MNKKVEVVTFYKEYAFCWCLLYVQGTVLVTKQGTVLVTKGDKLEKNIVHALKSLSAW